MEPDCCFAPELDDPDVDELDEPEEDARLDAAPAELTLPPEDELLVPAVPAFVPLFPLFP